MTVWIWLAQREFNYREHWLISNPLALLSTVIAMNSAALLVIILNRVCKLLKKTFALYLLVGVLCLIDTAIIILMQSQCTRSAIMAGFVVKEVLSVILVKNISVAASLLTDVAGLILIVSVTHVEYEQQLIYATMLTLYLWSMRHQLAEHFFLADVRYASSSKLPETSAQDGGKHNKRSFPLQASMLSNIFDLISDGIIVINDKEKSILFNEPVTKSILQCPQTQVLHQLYNMEFLDDFLLPGKYQELSATVDPNMGSFAENLRPKSTMADSRAMQPQSGSSQDRISSQSKNPCFKNSQTSSDQNQQSFRADLLSLQQSDTKLLQVSNLKPMASCSQEFSVIFNSSVRVGGRTYRLKYCQGGSLKVLVLQ